MKLKDLLLHIQNLSDSTPDVPTRRFIQAAYRKVMRTLSSEFDPQEDVQKAALQDLPLTANMKAKLEGLLKLRPLKISPLLGELAEIPGIGSQKSRELIENGLKNVKQLKQKKFLDMLNKSARLFVEKDPERKIPHEVIQQIESKIASPDWETYIVGSYRRQRPYSRDIDLMLVSDKEQDLHSYISFLKTRLPELLQYAIGPDKASFLVKFASKYYKFDVFRTPKKKKWAMLLYSTGSKEFNIKMRAHAKKLGYKLNQEGLYNKKEIAVKSEKDFFRILGLPYLEPPQRN